MIFEHALELSIVTLSCLVQVKRPGDKNVRCTILLLLDYQPLQFKLDPRLARLLGVHTQTRPVIISALWQYIKTHKLQVIAPTRLGGLKISMYVLCKTRGWGRKNKF